MSCKCNEEGKAAIGVIFIVLFVVFLIIDGCFSSASKTSGVILSRQYETKYGYSIVVNVDGASKKVEVDEKSFAKMEVGKVVDLDVTKGGAGTWTAKVVGEPYDATPERKN